MQSEATEQSAKHIPHKATAKKLRTKPIQSNRTKSWNNIWKQQLTPNRRFAGFLNLCNLLDPFWLPMLSRPRRGPSMAFLVVMAAVAAVWIRCAPFLSLDAQQPRRQMLLHLGIQWKSKRSPIGNAQKFQNGSPTEFKTNSSEQSHIHKIAVWFWVLLKSPQPSKQL